MKLKSTVGVALVAMAWTGAQIHVAQGQLVKAPRYTSTVDAPAPAAANLPALPAAISKGGTVVEDIVVRVNDQIISRSDVQRSEAAAGVRNLHSKICHRQSGHSGKRTCCGT